MKNPTDRAFVEYLADLKSRDFPAFMELVLESLKSFPDEAADEESDPETKDRAMTKILKYFESEERYEDCAFLRDLKAKISDGKKG